MEKTENLKPELKHFLQDDLIKSKIELAYSGKDSKVLFDFVNSRIQDFEEHLEKWYRDKAIEESPSISEDDKELNRDLRRLGF